MSEKNKIILFIAVFIAIIMLPALGEYISNSGHFIPHFLNFPPITAYPKPGFSLFAFSIIGLVCLIVSLLYLFPSLFGFKKKTEQSDEHFKSSRFPFWFWIGLTVNIPSLIILFTKIGYPLFVARYGYIFVFASFLFIIDGWVYKRTGGYSFVHDEPLRLLFVAVSSSISWLFYEYLNFFLLDNWVYPNGAMISKFAFNVYAIVGAATLIPVVFEVYLLIRTFPFFKERYQNGPKIALPVWFRAVLLVVMVVLMYFLPYYPFQLFFFTWLGPSLILAIILSFTNTWSPFTPIKDGNWTPMMLVCLADFAQGFLWEGVNYFSASHSPFFSPVPGYWTYSIPYVNVLHIFEMPLLGFWGYVAYGMNNFVWWIFFATIFGVSPIFKNGNFK